MFSEQGDNSKGNVERNKYSMATITIHNYYTEHWRSNVYTFYYEVF